MFRYIWKYTNRRLETKTTVVIAKDAFNNNNISIYSSMNPEVLCECGAYCHIHVKTDCEEERYINLWA